MTDPATVAKGLTKAQREALRKADKSGCIPVLATVVALSAMQWAIGHQMTFMFALGALIASIIGLWDAGRNSQIKERATEEFLRNLLEKEQ